MDPKDLSGYHLAFYGADSNQNSEYFERLQTVARQRGIAASFHDAVAKLDLLRAYCESSGQVHYAHADANPRSPYEGIHAGNPLFVTDESYLHPSIHQQPFVISVPSGTTEGFQEAFRRFMTLVRDSEQTAAAVRSFAKRELRPYAIYHEVCMRVGLCSARCLVDDGHCPPHDEA